MQFNRAIVSGGNFVFVQPSEVCFERLADQVATGAFFNSGELSEPGFCHPGTRESILEELQNWVLSCPYPFPIKWLHGPAGAGKSAIARTTAHWLSLRNLLIAAFFFFRADHRRNTVQHFIATIAYQLCRTIPAARPLVLAAVEDDPLIFSQSLSFQAQSLIINPCTRVYMDRQLPPDHPRVIIVDGLDECNGADRQREVLKVLYDVIQRLPFPVALLVASRPEVAIRNSFDAGVLNKASSRLVLDDRFKPDEDITRYFLDKFKEILGDHPLRQFIHSLESDPWPGKNIVMLLVQKASGQFTFATTAIRFISSQRHHPPDRLKVIVGVNPPGNLKPFEQLDNLYLTVLATVEDFPGARRILGVRLVPYTFKISSCHTPEYLEWFLGLEPRGEIQRLLIDLGSLLTFKDYSDPIQVFHASLADFLFDKSRAGKFYIDPGEIYEELVKQSILLIAEQGDKGYQLQMSAYLHMSDWFKNANCSSQLRQTIKGCDMASLAHFTLGRPNSPDPVGLRELCPMFLSAVQASAFSNAHDLYLQKYSEYEVHLKKALQIYLKGDHLTCILLCLHAGAKSGQWSGWNFLQSLVSSKETDDEGLGLLQYVRPPPSEHFRWNTFHRKTDSYPIENRHAQATLHYIGDLIDKLQDTDKLYAQAATFLLTEHSELPIKSAEMHCIGYLISKSAIQANLAYFLSTNLHRWEEYGHGNILPSVIIYLCKYNEIIRTEK